MRAFRGKLTLLEIGAVPAPLHLLGFITAYLIASSFGQWLMVLPGVEVTIWLPNGLVIAVLLSTEKPSWPFWIAVTVVGELTGNYLWFQNTLPSASGYALANVLEVLFAAALMSRFLPDHNLTSPR